MVLNFTYKMANLLKTRQSTKNTSLHGTTDIIGGGCERLWGWLLLARDPDSKTTMKEHPAYGIYGHHHPTSSFSWEMFKVLYFFFQFLYFSFIHSAFFSDATLNLGNNQLYIKNHPHPIRAIQSIPHQEGKTLTVEQVKNMLF